MDNCTLGEGEGSKTFLYMWHPWIEFPVLYGSLKQSTLYTFHAVAFQAPLDVVPKENKNKWTKVGKK